MLAEPLWRLALPTETLPPSDHTNAYLVGWRRALLIEPAPRQEEARRALLDWILAQGRRGLRVTALAVTHHHPDHVGAAAWLREQLGVPLWAHVRTAERLEVPVDRHLNDGERLLLRGARGEPCEVQALWTPGHAPGHLAFLVPSASTLLAGDMVSTESTILVDPDDGGDMSAYVASLRRLRALRVSRIAPAHGPPGPAGAVLDRFLAHRAMRRARVLAALGPAPRSLDRLLEVAYADRSQAPKALALRSLRAHLLQLQAEGAAEMAGQGCWRRKDGTEAAPS